MDQTHQKEIFPIPPISNCDNVSVIFDNEVSPHVVIFLEKRIVLHSSLLKLYIDAAAIYRNHLFDSAKTIF